MNNVKRRFYNRLFYYVTSLNSKEMSSAFISDLPKQGVIAWRELYIGIGGFAGVIDEIVSQLKHLKTNLWEGSQSSCIGDQTNR